MCLEEMIQGNESLQKECTSESTDEEDGILEEVMAFADFYPTEDNQLCLQKGDKVLIVSKNNADWWWARKGHSCGYIPTNHITSLSGDEAGWQDGEYFSSYNSMKLHHEMLQDKARNVAYRSAIMQNHQHIQDKVVLDVGCGTGILSMMSVKHGKASKVFAVEASGFAEHTQTLIEANGMSDKIQVFDGKIESVQLPHKVDLIISEWMGTFLLFEWMIESVIFARDHWLNDGGVVWPSHAGVYLVPCCAGELYKNKVSFWESVEDFDFSSLVPLAKDEFFSSPLYNHVMKQEDSLATPQQVFQLNMKTVTRQDLEEVSHTFHFTISKAGTMHGFASWFQVDFAGFPVNSKPFVFLNTGPDYPLTHWKQTLFMMDSPITVEQGDTVEGAITMTRNKEWRRHLEVHLALSVSSVSGQNAKTFTKLFPIWR
ncbi:protein arginine N-methyltransferase 2-like isoform X1 [Asterias amurensis]|uniref:protein arginine N-methyltransferase 2-like isoform X1 n=1 Tax=Asterias amurensis TaxID=7602 RepID=UPI003AB5A50E